MEHECAFCEIVAGIAPATVVRRWPEALALVPLNPVTPGHLIVVPVIHVKDLTSDPTVTAAVARRVAELATPPCNVITSAGILATQSVFHLHFHVLPRRLNDRVRLPWHSGKHDRTLTA